MWFDIIQSLLGNPIVTLTWVFILYRVFRPMKDSNGNKSNSLTVLFCTTLVIFMIAILDTMNDKPQSHVPQTIKISGSGKKIKSKRRRARITSKGKTRAVNKEKYQILGTVWIGCLLLYLLGHKGPMVWSWSVRFIMAIRGKHDPLEGVTHHPIEYYIINSLTHDSSETNREFILDLILARKGISAAKKPEEAEEEPDETTPVSAP